MVFFIAIDDVPRLKSWGRVMGSLPRINPWVGGNLEQLLIPTPKG